MAKLGLASDRRVVQTTHWPLVLITLATLTTGMINLFSAAFASQPAYFFAQLIWTAVAIGVGAFVYAIDYRIYERIAYILYAIIVVTLMIVLFTRPIGGSQRWIELGAFRFQPSELMKLILILALAKFYHNTPTPMGGFNLKALSVPILLVGVPMVLILLEPDLGTSLLLAILAGTLMLFARIRMKTIALFVVAALILIPVGWQFVLKDYQKQRILTMFDPGKDPRGTGYHRRQSIIAIGSGQLTGKGFREGTQTQLRFLPEQHTDFIFSVWAEEQGFIGSFTLLGLYLALILSGIHISSKAREKFGALVALGATAIIFWQVVINIGMVLGVMPTVGITLPLMSYGGTSLVVTMICIGLLMNVYARRTMF